MKLKLNTHQSKRKKLLKCLHLRLIDNRNRYKHKQYSQENLLLEFWKE